MSRITNVIFLGSSQLLYNCARKVRKYYDESVRIKVIDTSDSATQKKKKLQDEFGDTKEYISKSEIFEYLEHVSEKSFLFSINNPYILPKKICDNQNLVMINLHHALLPKHPGRNAEAWTIYEQDLYGGISWHFINQGIDAGNILYQKKISIDAEMTSFKLLRLCEKAALDSFDIFLPLSKIEKLQTIEQKRSGEIPKKAKDIPNNGILNLDWPVDKCMAFLNSFNYCGLNVLGFPYVKYHNIDYIIKKYEIKECSQELYKKITYIPEKNIFEIHEGNRFLIMTLEKAY